ncbi:MAG TPA: hypothetical protein VFR70_07565, partial [Flavobacterium sp.]|nr:hypothetical protein [Flavobacterium sp.]
VKNSFINHDEKILVEVKFNNFILDCNIGVALLNSSKSKVFTTVKAIDSRTDCIYCEIPSNLLLKGAYSFDVATFKNELVFEYVHDICLFQIVDLINDYKIYGDNIGDIKVNCRWSLNL